MPTDQSSIFRRFPRRRMVATLAGAGLLAIGVAGGAAVVAETRPAVSMAPAVPVAIRSLSTDGIVTIRGQVAEIYGNKFVMSDGSGRALVDTGREGDRQALVTAGEPVTVQGRFDRGFVHAAFLVGPDSEVVALGPLGGPHGHGAPHDRDRGPDGPGGDRADNAPPPPPPPAPGAARNGDTPPPAPAPAAAR